MLFQIIFFLRPVGVKHRDDLADRRCCCARAIAVPVERLLLTFALRPNFFGTPQSPRRYPCVGRKRRWLCPAVGSRYGVQAVGRRNPEQSAMAPLVSSNLSTIATIALGQRHSEFGSRLPFNGRNPRSTS